MGHWRVLRDESAPGYIVGRNRLVRHALNPTVLLLDDDASILEPRLKRASN
jgi:glycosyltransferase involved in cell wall biosynthesis